MAENDDKPYDLGFGFDKEPEPQVAKAAPNDSMVLLGAMIGGFLARLIGDHVERTRRKAQDDLVPTPETKAVVDETKAIIDRAIRSDVGKLHERPRKKRSRKSRKD